LHAHQSASWSGTMSTPGDPRMAAPRCHDASAIR
jgi:hypothetical protein